MCASAAVERCARALRYLDAVEPPFIGSVSATAFFDPEAAFVPPSPLLNGLSAPAPPSRPKLTQISLFHVCRKHFTSH